MYSVLGYSTAVVPLQEVFAMTSAFRLGDLMTFGTDTGLPDQRILGVDSDGFPILDDDFLSECVPDTTYYAAPAAPEFSYWPVYCSSFA
jgi:hypothetical protein